MSDASTPSNPLAGLSALKLAMMARQVRERTAPVMRADPIAIVGMGCRVPGGADTPESFWTLLAGGRDAIREVPAERWSNEAWFDADLSAPGKVATRHGGFLDAIDGFDAEYFGILPREAQRMDPQQRLFLEVAIEALDDAGLTRDALRGSRSGVFIASYHNDYAQMQYADVEDIDARTLTGTLHSVLANRLSYFLDLRGPSISIDTACSSSLVATHLACQSLRMGESDIAIAGGVSLMIGPELFVSMSKVGFMSPDGRSKTFDERADGFGRGEGCGVVVLRRLADAVAAGDRVLAVLRGSAVNQDGHSTLLAAPSGPAQQALIEEALAGAQLDAGRIGLVETHGTGTALGDPIEVEAIAATIGKKAPGAGNCLLGSAKANIGHLEAAAGVTGLIKAVLSLRHEAVPPQPNFQRLSPHITLEGTRLAVPVQLTPWPRGALPRCAAVSSFGVGGTNAHVIVEEAPGLPGSAGVGRDASRILTLSAHSHAALRAQASSWVRFLGATPQDVADICFTATQRRSHLEHRLAVVGRTKQELAARIDEALTENEMRCDPAARATATAPRVAFVFSGQGPQWHSMGRELMAAEPVFRRVIEDCDRLLRPLAGWSLLDELNAPEERSRMDHTEVAQPAIFALQAALVELLGSWGVRADGVVGHSVGEIAALHTAGVLSLDEALRVVWHRGRIMQQATGRGGMASVALGAEDAHALLLAHEGRLGVAAVNAPKSVVLSGDEAALDAVLAGLEARGVEHRRLPVRYAFHSAQMEPFAQRLVDELRSVRRDPARIDLYSTVSGGRAADAAFDAGYFGRNVRQPVRFADTVAAMAEDGIDVFVEIGPHPVLAGSLADCLAAAGVDATVVGSLRRGRAERDSLLQACATLYEAGCMPRWSAIQEGAGELASLPAVAWQRKRHWLRTRPASSPAALGPRTIAPADHPLLGERIDVAGTGTSVFQGSSAAAHGWLSDHRLFGALLLPAAAVMESFAAAAQRVARAHAVTLTDFAIERPLVVPEAADGPARWQTVVTPTQADRWAIEMFEAVQATGEASSPWRRIASASAASVDARVMPMPACPPLSATSPQAVYERFDALGVAFGPLFRCLHEVSQGERSAQAWIELPQPLCESLEPHLLHPVLLDAALQLCSVAAGLATGALPKVMLPLGADRIDIRGSQARRLLARASLGDASGETLNATLTLDTAEGERVATVEGMRFAPAQAGAFARRGAIDPWLYELGWQPATGSSADDTQGAQGWWVVLGDAQGVGGMLADALTAQGGRCVRVTPGSDFTRSSERAWVIDPSQPAHFRRLIDEGPWRESADLRAVFHLWALDASAGEAPGELAGDALSIASAAHAAQALVGAQQAARVWLVSRGSQAIADEVLAGGRQPHGAGLRGLASVIAIEHPELGVRCVDLDPAEDDLQCAARLARLALSASDLRDIAVRRGGLWEPRLRRYAPRPSPERGTLQRLEVVRAGTLEGVAMQVMQSVPVQPHEVRLQVLCAGLNFRDVLLALGMYPGDGVPLGAECAGRVIEAGARVAGLRVGDAVFGFVPAGMATEAVVPAAFLAKIPEQLSVEQAAGFPVAFLTAFHGLTNLGKLQRGERVLIHAAAGGVGLAAVQLALRCGAEVFATAGSDDKRAMLRSLGVAHVMDSRSLGFADEVLAATAGEGVHVVLNSLAGDFIAASLRVLGAGGRFLELGKRDIMTPEAVARSRPDVGYRAFDLGSSAQAEHALLAPMFDELLAGLRDGTLRALPVKVYPVEAAQDAFRFMAQARHTGKIVLRMPDAGAAGQPLVHADGTYWITGGLGALGMETARWLAGHGARHIVLSGRHAPGEAAARGIESLRRDGVEVHVRRADAADRDAMSRVFDDIAANMPRLRGVVHAAGTVRDGVLMAQQWPDMQAVLAGKANGAWILHELTRDTPLDFFVLYAAAGLHLGPRGQGAYPAANAQLDALAHMRRSLGLPALSVAWGAWDGAGMAARSAARGRDEWAERGLGRITPAEGFARLERLLRDRATCAVVLPIDWARFLARLPAGASAAFYQDMSPRAAASSGGPADPQAGKTLVERLRSLPPMQRREALASHLKERTLHVLGLEASTPVAPRVPLKDIGLDSLMAVELRNALTRSTGHGLPATLLFDYPTLDALTGHLARRLGLEEDAPAAPLRPVGAGSGACEPPPDVATLSEAEAEALLLAELDGTAAKE